MLAIGGGLVLGREGPAVQMGGRGRRRYLKVVEGITARTIDLDRGLVLRRTCRLRLLTLLYPGLVFVLEEVQRDFDPVRLWHGVPRGGGSRCSGAVGSESIPCFLCHQISNPAIGDACRRSRCLDRGCRIARRSFNRGLIASLNFYGRVKNKLAAAAITGAVIGMIGWFVPIVIGNGHALAELTLVGRIALLAIPGWFLTVSS